MKFNVAYSREDFTRFLEINFLPEDFNKEISPINVSGNNYIKEVTRLGECESVGLIIYEVKHSGKRDPRVSLSKEAFKLLANEWHSKALVVFVPEGSDKNYRFSYVSIELNMTDEGRINKLYSNPRRYSYYLGEGVGERTPKEYLQNKGRVKDEEDLLNRFSVEVLTKAFYGELSDWYAWAVKKVSFPNSIEDKSDDEKYNHEAVIRLITRLIFVWFIKQKKLIPNEFFDEGYISSNLLKDFAPHEQFGLFSEKSDEGKYYKAILQNLFFAMLNSPVVSTKGDLERRFIKPSFHGMNHDHDNKKVMRYKSMFSNPDHFVELANKYVPFLNGGLFDCLDDKEAGVFLDGFSDNSKINKSLRVPDYLFFGEEAGKDIDLSEFYGDAKKKKVSARGIIDILKRYNFTIEENTPFDQDVSLDPELLGKVFENLLASFNPETKTTARKQTGSFYTPREVVQYMVDESLVAHLKRTVGAELEGEFRKLMSYTDEEVSFTTDVRRKIVNAIHNCKILDPACGSGAFPMGVLQQMVHILTRVDSDNEIWKEVLLDDATDDTKVTFKYSTEGDRKEAIEDIYRSFDESLNRPDYARKLYLIEKCIYGVDIQSIAIQISKLRFFISLVIDQRRNDNPKDNFGIRPLPNLEAKFVAANTLINLRKEELNLFDTQYILDKEEELKVANHKIFGAKTYKTKTNWRNRVNELREDIAKHLLEMNYVSGTTASQLQKWDMFDQNTHAPFFNVEWMFGLKDGFDLVIGNPPYVQLQANGGALAEQFKNEAYETYARTGDIYSLFYEKGWQLLSEDGLLCYITSNKWMRAGYGEKTRAFFTSKTNPILLIDFAGTKVFESATVDTNILLFSKSENQANTKCAIVNSKKSLEKMSDYVQQNNSFCSFKEGDSWVILSPIELSIKKKIEAIGTPLKDWDIQINYGIKTGCNEAFIITGAKKDEILSKCSSQEEFARTVELIRPILRGRDIKRYSAEYADLWLIATFPSRQYDIEQYPAVKQYLLDFGKERLEQTGRTHILRGERIKSRKKTNNKWFETQDSISYWEDFSKPKIVYSEIVREPQFYYDMNEYFPEATVFILSGESLKYLRFLLCSKLITYSFKKIYAGGGLGEDGYRYKKAFLLPVPIVKLSKQEEEKFLYSIDRLNDDHTDIAMFEENIDNLIYKLYGLSEDEIRVIESK